MKSLILLLIASIVFVVSSCGENRTNQQVIYKDNNNYRPNYNNNQGYNPNYNNHTFVPVPVVINKTVQPSKRYHEPVSTQYVVTPNKRTFLTPRTTPKSYMKYTPSKPSYTPSKSYTAPKSSSSYGYKYSSSYRSSSSYKPSRSYRR